MDRTDAQASYRGRGLAAGWRAKQRIGFGAAAQVAVPGSSVGGLARAVSHATFGRRSCAPAVVVRIASTFGRPSVAPRYPVGAAIYQDDEPATADMVRTLGVTRQSASRAPTGVRQARS